VALHAAPVHAVLDHRPRRRGAPRRATPRTIERAVAAARENDEPLTALLVSDARGAEPQSAIARLLRRRVRHSDAVLRVPGKSLLVLAAGTDLGAAAALASEVRKYLARRSADTLVVEVVPLWPDELGADLLSRPAKAWAPPAADRADGLDVDSISVEPLMRRPYDRSDDAR
jgi:hypothetical protein